MLTPFPTHLLDDENRKLVNPVVDASGRNPASGGYAEGGGVATTPHTGGTQLDGVQTGGTYVTPEHKLNPGVMYSETGDSKDIGNSQDDKIAKLAQQALFDEITKFQSKTQVGKVATMVGAYDPVTGMTAVGTSSGSINVDALHPATVKYIGSQLGVEIGQFTALCKNKVGACAEVSGADQLVRRGANPAGIKFTDAVRPRDVWGKNNLSDGLIKACENCSAIWSSGG
ncbi:hypothetical protein [Pseudomonas sp. CF161]|uniref:hypothetical protein n=1 Tax=Pseudomonas sp. CF161 TaxID=911241 RepID=UPI0015A6ACEC|nr:hypothetical protein [Pseudomonas sp. CF161]